MNLRRSLNQRASWWRHAWPYRWAHKPLCERFSADVLRLGRLSLCRSCSALWAGLGLTALLSWNQAIQPEAAPRALSVLLPTVAVFSHPALHSRWPRLVRDLLRGMAGASVALAALATLGGQLLEGLLALAALAAMMRLYTLQRAPRRARMCDGCPEALEAHTCSGFRQQAAATAAHELEMERDLIASGFVPPLPHRLQGPTP